MTLPVFNPARVLQNLLQQISADPNEDLRGALATIFGTEQIEFVDNANKLDALFKSVKNEVENADLPLDDRALLLEYLKPFNTFEIYDRLFTIIGRAPSGFLSERSLHNLRIICLALDGTTTAVDLSADLSGLISEIDELRDNLVSLELPKKLKLSIDRRLSQIRSGLVDYKLWGIDALEEAVIGLTGEIILYHEQFESAEAKNYTKNLGKHITGFRSLIAKGRGYEKDAGWVLEKMDDMKNLLEYLPI